MCYTASSKELVKVNAVNFKVQEVKQQDEPHGNPQQVKVCMDGHLK